MIKTLSRKSIYLIPILILVGTLILRIDNPQFLQVFQLKLFDLYNQIQPREYKEAPVVILDLDDETLARTALQWPWPRSKLAEMLIYVFEAGAKVLAFDVVFPEPDRTSPKQALSIWFGDTKRDKLSTEAKAIFDKISPALESIPDHDEYFAHIIAQIDAAAKDLGVVTGMVLTSELQQGSLPPIKSGFAVAGDDPRQFLPAFSGSVRNLAPIDEAASGLGSFNLVPEPDGIVRRTPTILRIGKQLYPSLALEALRVFQGASTYILKASGANLETSFGERTGLNHVRVGRYTIPVDGEGRFWVHYTDVEQKRVLPLWKVFEEDFDPKLVAGKIVFFGTSASGLKDLRATPMNPVAAGVEVHAQVAEQILNGHFLSRPDWAEGAELLFMFIIGTIVVFLVPRFGAAAGATIGFCFIASALIFSWYVYSEQLILTDPLYPSLSIFAVYLSSALIRYLQTEAEREQVRGAFSQYLSPALVEQLAAEPERLKLGGEMRDMTLLFCDVRGFTTISETYKSNPQGLTTLINRLLTPLTDVILAHKGTIDKYMGDCIMAFWNAPLSDEAHIRHACEAALLMFKELNQLNELREKEAIELNQQYLPLNIGVGINTGECVVGNMGSKQRFDYSVLGDAVNLAARLEGQSKNYGVDIVIGETTNAIATNHFATLELDLIAVKGKKEAVRIYALLGDQQQKENADFQNLHKDHSTMLKLYRERKWEDARNIIDTCAAQDGRLSTLYQMYMERIDQYIKNPPTENWDGVYVAISK